MNFYMPNIIKKRKIGIRLPFSNDEDEKLKIIVKNLQKGDGNIMNQEKDDLINWKIVSKKMGNRTPRQCKERYLHYLSPKINKNNWSSEEDSQLLASVCQYGKRWKVLEKVFTDRTEIDIRNRFYVLQRRISKAAKSKFINNFTRTANLCKITKNKKIDQLNSNIDQKNISENNNENELNFNEQTQSIDIDKDIKDNDPFGNKFDIFNEFSDFPTDNHQIIYEDSNISELFNGCLYEPIFYM